MPTSQGTQRRNQDGPLWKTGATCTYLCLVTWAKKSQEIGETYWKPRVRGTLKTHMSLQDSAGNQRWKSGHSPARSLDRGKNSQISPLLFQHTRALHLAGWPRRWAWKDSHENSSNVSQWPERNQRRLPNQRGIKNNHANTSNHASSGRQVCEAGLGALKDRDMSLTPSSTGHLIAVVLWAVPFHPWSCCLTSRAITKISTESSWGPRRQWKSKQYHSNISHSHLFWSAFLVTDWTFHSV